MAAETTGHEQPEKIAHEDLRLDHDPGALRPLAGAELHSSGTRATATS